MKVEVLGRDEGQRLDVFVAVTSGVTRSVAQRAIRAGRITVDGRAARPSLRLEAGQVVQGDPGTAGVARPEPEQIAVDIAYEDERVLVVSKPAGMVTHPAAGHNEGTLVNALLGLEVPLARPGSTRPGIVHRLDKGTSGLLLVAKDDRAQDALIDALRRREVTRSYLALVRDHLPAATGTFEAPIGRHPKNRRVMAVVAEGRPAVTHYRVIAATELDCLLDVTLETGRTHQIRVHLSHFGHPIRGDSVYGGGGERAAQLGLGRPFLHAYGLVFPHPDDGRTITVTDGLPSDLVAALATAGITPPPLD